MPDFPLDRRRLLAGAALITLPATARAQTAQPAPSAASAVAPAPVRQEKLVLAPGKTVFRPDAPDSEIITVNGSITGPTIRTKRGEPIDLVVENRLGQPTALTIHGQRGVNGAQQVPGLGSEAIKPGETRTVRIETPDAGTFLYLPTLAGRTSEQLERGLSGFFIVEETKLPDIDSDVTLTLDDIRLTDKGQADGDFGGLIDSLRAGRLGNALLVNGRTGPQDIRTRPNARLRLRIANTANARIMPMKFENLKATVVALDGQACDPFDPLKRTVILVPGSRFDVVVDVNAEAGAEGRILIAIGNGFPVLRVIPEGAALPPRPPVERLAMNDLPAEIRLQNAVRAEVAITGGLPRANDPAAPPPSREDLARRFPDRMKIWSVNGGYSNGFYGKPLFTAKRGAPVVLALVNRTDWPQVLTVHGHVFRLLHPLDDGWEPYFLDTIHLPAQTTSRIAFDAQNVGKWAIRSTIPEHYDGGVFTWFEVQG